MSETNYMFMIKVERDDERGCYGEAFVAAPNKEKAKELFLESTENSDAVDIMEGNIDDWDDGVVVAKCLGYVGDEYPVGFVTEKWD